MAVISSPSTLESFAESRLKTLLEAQLTKIPGIGSKTAKRMILELKDKLI